MASWKSVKCDLGFEKSEIEKKIRQIEVRIGSPERSTAYDRCTFYTNQDNWIKRAF